MEGKVEMDTSDSVVVLVADADVTLEGQFGYLAGDVSYTRKSARIGYDVIDSTNIANPKLSFPSIFLT